MRILRYLAAGFTFSLALGACTAVESKTADRAETTTTTSAPDAPNCTLTQPPATILGSVQSQGINRDFVVSLPAGYTGAEPTPAILNLHGAGSSKEQQVIYSGLPAAGAERGYIVITPDGLVPDGGSQGREWNMFREPGADDYTFVDNLLAYLNSMLCIDADRVFSAGISNGAGMTAGLACAPPTRFAAIALVAGTVPAVDCPDDANVSVVAFHGTTDPVIPYMGGDVNFSAAHGRPAPAAEDAIGSWARVDGCDTMPTESAVTPQVQMTSYEGCDGDAEVILYSLQDGGHTWPGSAIDLAALGIDQLGATVMDISATNTILDFFDRHPRTGEATASS